MIQKIRFLSLEEHCFNLKKFDCGNHALNYFIRKHSLSNEGVISRTFIAVDKEDYANIIGYYTICMYSIDYTCLPEDLRQADNCKLPARPVPVALLARLAVDKREQGKSFGSTLLLEVLKSVLAASKEIGVYGVVVHAKNESARNFYQKFGFVELTDDKLHLFMSIVTIKELFNNTV